MDGLIPRDQREKEDAYHFVVYLPYAGSIYEFDGLKRAPIRHGAYQEGGEGWVGAAR
jgi:ubiquitin carboxyl-terminal hydrolase L5